MLVLRKSIVPPSIHSRRGFVCYSGLFGAILLFATTFAYPEKLHALEPNTTTSAAPAAAPASGQPLQANGPPKFELDIQPILTAYGCNSGACHGKARGQNGFALSLLGFDAEMDYKAMVKDARGRRIFPSSPEQSLLLTKSTGEHPHGGGVRFAPDSEVYQTLYQWIQHGMLRVDQDDPHLERIAITPEPLPMKRRSQQELTVTAFYSDGSSRDVTSTCAYLSNEPAIVAVTPKGALTSGNLPGEATIMARYMGHIATWSTFIPLEDARGPTEYANLTKKNFIDELVWKKLQQMNVLPSEGISDEKFLRRASLDLIGRLPTVEETRTFLASSAADKRDALVNDLLNRPEYADFWANKWADLLRPNPYRVGIKATLSLDGWLRNAFRENWPYDRFATELLTARGSTWRNGAVTVFRDRRSPDEIAPMFSQLFLGARLDCAKCHQHPFETYGQKEFYSLAAYFARVGYKGTGLSPPISGGEEMVLVASKGETRHPLTGEVLPPKPLYGSAREVGEDEDPRQVFAEWAVSPENPNFAMVGANRIWGEIFGLGIVDPVDDFRATNPPSNPELLQALGNYFREVNFDQKELLRLIVQSEVYARSSLPSTSNAGDHRNFSRHYRRRMRAESLADAVADITEIADRFEGLPAGSRAVEIWTHRADSEFLDAFGRPDPNQDPPCERTPEATMVQALHLMNAPAIQAKLAHDQGRVARLAASHLTPHELIDDLYLCTYNRFPTPAEQLALVADYNQPNTQRRQWIEDLLWSLLNSPEFIYED